MIRSFTCLRGEGGEGERDESQRLAAGRDDDQVLHVSEGEGGEGQRDVHGCLDVNTFALRGLTSVDF